MRYFIVLAALTVASPVLADGAADGAQDCFCVQNRIEVRAAWNCKIVEDGDPAVVVCSDVIRKAWSEINLTAGWERVFPGEGICPASCGEPSCADTSLVMRGGDC